MESALRRHLHVVHLVLPLKGLKLQVEVVLSKRITLLGKFPAHSSEALDTILRLEHVGFQLLPGLHFRSHVRGVVC